MLTPDQCVSGNDSNEDVNDVQLRVVAGDIAQALPAQERKRRRAQIAREAKRAKMEQHRAGERPVAFPIAWSEAQQRAVQDSLWQRTLASKASRAQNLGVSADWLHRMNMVLSEMLLLAEQEAWQAFLSIVAQESRAGRFRAHMFGYTRMYDETPQRAWVFSLDETGAKDGSATTAKVMASHVGFVMVLEVVCKDTETVKAEVTPAAMVHVALADSRSNAAEHIEDQSQGELHIIHGGLGTPLANLASLKGPVVLHSIRANMWMNPEIQEQIENTFARCVLLRMSDMHSSNTCAEREEARRVGSRWASSFFRCSMHRIRTAELTWLKHLELRVESFFLNVTLCLRRTPDCWASYTRRAREWLGSVQARPQGLPDSVSAWRTELSKLIFHDAKQNRGTSRRQACFDTVTLGDGRVPGRPQHWKCSRHCCPTKGHTVKLFQGLLCHNVLCGVPPPLFPRKSWTGQAEAMNPVIQWQATHGMLLACFKSVEQTAKLRRDKVVAALAAKRDRKILAEQQQTHAAIPDPDERDDEAAKQAEQNARRARDVVDFLTDPGALRSMLRMRILLEPFRVLKGAVLHSGGQARELQRGSDEGTFFQFRVCVAATCREAFQALLSLTDLMHEPWRALEGLETGGRPDGELRWREISVAGAALYHYVVAEQRTYPWKLFRILLEGECVADEILEDARSCKNILDPLAAQHILRFPTRAALVGRLSRTELVAMAMVLEDTTVRVERGHAGEKRATRVREQTHAARLTDVSAQVLITRLRNLGNTWHGTLRETQSEGGSKIKRIRKLALRTRKLAVRSENPVAHADREHPDTQRTKRRPGFIGAGRRRQVSRRDAWMSVHAAGHKITSADHEKFRAAMLNPSEAERYDDIARTMTKAPRRKTKKTPGHEAALRRARDNATRANLPWSAREARKRIEGDRQTSVFQALEEATRRCKAARKAGAEVTSARLQELRRLGTNVKKTAALFRGTVHEQELVQCAVLSSLPNVFGALWGSLARSTVAHRLPQAMLKARTHVLRWEARHATLEAARGVAKIRAETRGERKRKLCTLAGFCVCRLDQRHVYAMVQSLCSVLRVALGKPGSAMRAAVQNAYVVVRLISQTTCLQEEFSWFHTPLIALDEMRPVFLRCLQTRTYDCSTDCHLIAAVRKEDPRMLFWQTVWEVVQLLDPKGNHSMEFWRIVGGEHDPSQGVRVQLYKDMSRMSMWNGEDDLQGAMEKEDSESLAEDEPGSCEENADSESLADSDTPGHTPADSNTLADSRGVKDSDTLAHSRGVNDVPEDAPRPETVVIPQATAPSIVTPQPAVVALALDVATVMSRGQRGENIFITMEDGNRTQIRVTHKQPTKKNMFGAYQILCRHHEPDVHLNKHGRKFKLPCRRTRCCRSPGDDANVLAVLQRWARQATNVNTRVQHQALGKGKESSSSSCGSSSTSSTSSSAQGKDSLPVVSNAGLAHSQAAQPADVQVTCVPVDARVIATRCDMCGGDHDHTECPFWLWACAESLEEHKRHAQRLRCALPLSRAGCCILAEWVTLRDVPGDGDCMFHALGREIYSRYPHEPEMQYAGAKSNEPGPFWRKYLTAFASFSQRRVDGLSVAEWIEVVTRRTVPDYIAYVNSQRRPWGGFFELALICAAWRRGLCCVVLEPRAGSFRVLGTAGAQQAERLQTVYLSWSGNHYQRARVQAQGSKRIREWENTS